MEELLYTDRDSKYFLLDYSPSHSELVIRSMKADEYNIDLFFKAVYVININTKLTGINVYKVHRPDIYQSNNVAGRNHIFKITDNNGITFYIDAGLFVVFQNNLKLLETSLGDFTWTSDNREITSSPIN